MANFDVFITHSIEEKDCLFADKLKKEFSRYRVPGNISRKQGEMKIKSVFMDPEIKEDVIPDENIMDILQSSRFLIVICSPNAVRSKRVMHILETFWRLKKGNNILTLLVEGKPDESFPPLVRKVVRNIWSEKDNVDIEETVEIEPLAADISTPIPDLGKSMKLLKTEQLRLIAPLLGCTFDDLRRRHYHNTLKKVMALFTITTLFGIFSIFSAYAFISDVDKKDQRVTAEKEKAKIKSEKSAKLTEMSVQSLLRFYTGTLEGSSGETREKITELLKTRSDSDYKAMKDGENVRANDIFNTCAEVTEFLALLRIQRNIASHEKLLASFESLFSDELNWVNEYVVHATALNEEQINCYLIFICSDQVTDNKEESGLMMGDVIYLIEGKKFENRAQLDEFLKNYNEFRDISSNPKAHVKFLRPNDSGVFEGYELDVDLYSVSWVLL